jgi:hypothetical protein
MKLEILGVIFSRRPIFLGVTSDGVRPLLIELNFSLKLQQNRWGMKREEHPAPRVVCICSGRDWLAQMD